MRWLISDGKVQNWLLAGILVFVGWMQIESALNRGEKQQEVDEFIKQGERFTKEDGETLRHRIQMLEHRIEILENIERTEHARK